MKASVFRPLMAAFSFLTRLPVYAGGALPDRDLGRAVGFFPVVGLVIGLLTTGLAYGLVAVLPPTMAAVLLATFGAALSGALHLDGLSDLFDGLGGGRGDRDKTLAIMRDSRIGAHGAVALILLIAAKITALATLLEAPNYLALVAFPVIARWVVVPLIVVFPYARPEGLGRAFSGEAGAREMVIATLTTAAVIAGLGPSLARPAAMALVVVLLLGLWLRARLGGLTGDVYGAAIEIAEVTVLTMASLG